MPMQVNTVSVNGEKYVSIDDFLLVLYQTEPMDAATKFTIEQLLSLR